MSEGLHDVQNAQPGAPCAIQRVIQIGQSRHKALAMNERVQNGGPLEVVLNPSLKDLKGRQRI